MKDIIFNVCFFLVLMLLIFIIDYFFIMKRKMNSKKKKKSKDIMEFNYLIYKFKLDENKVLYKPMCFWCSLINAFIISFVVTVISVIKVKMVWQLLIGFVLLFSLIYAIYEIYGRHLARKGWKKDE